jgi:hypothetical protein
MAAKGQQIVLGVLVGVAALVAYQTWPRTSADPTPALAGRAVGAAQARATPQAAAVPDVRLQALQARRPTPLPVDRNLFGFKLKAAPAPPPFVKGPVVPPPVPTEPPPSRLAPIPYRFLGIVEAPDRSLVIAVLSDGRITVHGRVGDLVEGRYRILRIGPDSIEMAYADGRGRQTIRLTGS